MTEKPGLRIDIIEQIRQVLEAKYPTRDAATLMANAPLWLAWCVEKIDELERERHRNWEEVRARQLKADDA